MTIALVFDTETTGLPLPRTVDVSKQPRIIDFAVAIVDCFKNQVVDRYETLLDPEVEVTDEITKITGITNEMLKGQPKFREVLARIEEIFGAAHHLVAHNAPFDRKMLEFELVRVGRTGFPWPEVHCSIQEFRHLFGYKPKLTELYEKTMGVPLAQKHRAMADVEALTDVLINREFFKGLCSETDEQPETEKSDSASPQD